MAIVCDKCRKYIGKGKIFRADTGTEDQDMCESCAFEMDNLMRKWFGLKEITRAERDRMLEDRKKEEASEWDDD